jgi:hypothetical protein
MHTLPMPVRRACAICGRKEAAASLHLTTVFEEGQPTRACDQCRDQLSWFCQSRNCRKEQVGSQHVIGGLALCGPCARPLEVAS